MLACACITAIEFVVLCSSLALMDNFAAHQTDCAAYRESGAALWRVGVHL